MRNVLIAALAAIFTLFAFSAFTTSANAGNPHNNKQTWGEEMERPHAGHKKKIYRKRLRQKRSKRRVVKRSRRMIVEKQYRRRTNGSSALQLMAKFEDCMRRKGFVLGRDFQTKPKKILVAGQKVTTGYLERAQRYVRTNPTLRIKYDSCRVVGGLS